MLWRGSGLGEDSGQCAQSVFDVTDGDEYMFAGAVIFCK